MTAAATAGAAERTPRGWPFFAPTADGAIDDALTLAGVGPGQRMVDLGCGEGHVLVAAARRGARVTGVESDRTLAATARHALAEAEVAGEVLVGDLFDRKLWTGDGPDVVFAYLSPATLQRLRPVVDSLPGTRLVTVDFDVPDLTPDVTRGAARLYRLPGGRRQVAADARPWPASGTLCVMPPGVCSLTSLEVLHPGGPVSVTLRGTMARNAALAAGADEVGPGAPVAIDLRWRERPAGTLARGSVEVEGVPSHPLTVLFAEEEQGQWDLSPEGCADLVTRLRRRNLPRPTTTRELLDALT